MDFDSFVITGPVTTSLSIAKATGGVAAPAANTAMSHKTTCATDQFSVSNAPNVPTVCGTLTGDHSKFYVPISVLFFLVMIFSVKISVILTNT